MFPRLGVSSIRTAASTVALVLLLTAAAASHEYASGPIKVVHPWAAATTPGATVGAGYMKIVNTGPTPIRLLGAGSPASNKVEIHSMSMDGGVMRMRPLPGGLIVPANGQVQLKPGGLHLMLIGLKRPLLEAELVPLTLAFEGGVSMNVELRVENRGAPASGHGH